jgi:hypothetical protein
MRGCRFIFATGLGVLTASCASTASETEPARAAGPAAAKKARDPSWRPGSMPVKIGDEAHEEEMAVEGGRGTLEQRDVDAVMKGHLPKLVTCAEEAGAARRYTAGEVTLRFFVSSRGDVSNVVVVSSSVGNFAVERCLVEQGRHLRMPRPRGGKGADFQYSLLFRAEAAVVDWKEEMVAKQVAHLVPRLGPCGELAPAPVKAVLYIEPGGAVGSVGLSSESPLDMEAATCAVQQIRRWRLRDDRKRVVRTGFQLGESADNAAPDGEPDADGDAMPAPRPRLVKRLPRGR